MNKIVVTLSALMIVCLPPLSVQSKDIGAALHVYEPGQRKHLSMHTLSTSLSDQEIADLAAYYESSGAAVQLPVVAAEGSTKAVELVTKGGTTSSWG